MKILCIGYFGYGNAGDEEMLQKGSALLWECGASQIFVASKRQPFYTLMSFFKATHIVYLGGNLFQDKTSVASIFYYAGFSWLASLFKKPVLLVGQGIGPLRTSLGKRLAKWVFTKAHFKSVRDGYSKSITEEWGIQNVRLHCDLSYVNQDFALQKEAVDTVGVSLMPCRQELLEKLRIVIAQVPNAARFISAYHPLDWAFWAPFWKAAPQALPQGLYAPLRLETLFKDKTAPISGIISMRYHTCVWASQQGIPFLVVSEDPKCLQLAKELNQPAINLLKIHDEDQIATFTRQFLDHVEEYKRKLLLQREEFRQRATELEKDLKEALV